MDIKTEASELVNSYEELGFETHIAKKCAIIAVRYNHNKKVEEANAVRETHPDVAENAIAYHAKLLELMLEEINAL